MGSILCCVDNKREFIVGRPDDDYRNDAEESNTKTFLKHPIEHKDDLERGNAETPRTTTDNQIDKAALEDYVDDHLDQYAFDGADEEEIEEFSQRRNEFEKDVVFTKRGIIDHIERTIAESVNDPVQAKLWELKLNKDEVKVYIKKGGSEFNPDLPYIKTEVVFNAFFQMNKIINAIFNEKHRMAWDKNVLKYELTPLTQRNTVITYQMNKSPLNFANRDFVDKHLKFSSDGKFYCYYTSIPNDTEFRELPPKVDRAQTIIGMQKLERRPEDGKIVYTMLLQCDLKMKVTPKLISMFLPAGMQDWSRKINKYLNDKYDQLD